MMISAATTMTTTRASFLLMGRNGVYRLPKNDSLARVRSVQLSSSSSSFGRWKSSTWTSTSSSSLSTSSSSSSKSLWTTCSNRIMHTTGSSSSSSYKHSFVVAVAGATVGGSALGLASYYCYGYYCCCYGGSSSSSNGWNQQQQQQQTVLACSTATAVDSDSDSDSDNLLLLRFDDDDETTTSATTTTTTTVQRIVHWLQETLQLMWETVLVSIRTSEVALRLSPLLILTPASMAADAILQLVWMHHNTTTTTQQQQHYRNLLADAAWWYTTYAMQALGPSFVKLCQWIATRRDIFPPTVCDRLSRLHDDGIPHSWKFTVQQLKEAFGEDYEANGLHIDSPQDILGCGSAAQVYFGTLQEKDPITGELLPEHHAVAIKVLHPNFQRNVERDLWLMDTIAKLLHALPFEVIKMVNLPRACATFGSVLRRQADLRIEANNLRQFRANFLQNSHKNNNEYADVVFPQPMEGWTTEQVLVEEYIGDAIPISQYLRDTTEKGSQVRSELAAPLLKAFLKMVFLDNFVHSDLHPGNVQVVTVEKQQEQAAAMARRNTATAKQQKQQQQQQKHQNPKHHQQQEITRHKIVFLDAGIATSLCPNDQKNLKDLFRAVLLNDGDRAGRLMVERARYERCSQVEGGVDAFAAGIQGIVSEFHDRRKEGLTLGSVRIGALLSQVLDLCRIHHVEVNPSMATIIISTLILEGLGRSLEPNLNLIDASIPFVLGRSIRDSWRRKGTTATTTTANESSYQ